MCGGLSSLRVREMRCFLLPSLLMLVRNVR